MFVEDVISMSIELSNKDGVNFSKGTFSKRSFQNFVVSPIMRYYGVDDEGNPHKTIEKNKVKNFGILDFFQYSYDDMYKDIEKVLKSVTDERNLGQYPNICKQIEKFFNKYKGKKSPDKKKFVNDCRSKYKEKGKSNLLKKLKRYYLKSSQVDLYDIMAVHIQEKVLSFPDNKMLGCSQIDQLIKIIDKYKQHLSPNKKNYIMSISDQLSLAKEAIKAINGFIEEGDRVLTRDIVCVFRALQDDDYIPDVKKILTQLANKLVRRSIDEVARENAVQFMNKYKSE